MLIYIGFITFNFANDVSNQRLFLKYLKEKQKEENHVQENNSLEIFDITIERPNTKNIISNNKPNTLQNNLKYNTQEKKIINKPIDFSFPSNLEPYPEDKKFYKYNKPLFIKGIYINNVKIFKKDFRELIKKAKDHDINTLVIDIQPKLIPVDIINQLLSENFYLIARIVVFDQGFNEYPPSREHLIYIQKLIEKATISINSGFHEVQLDYIRFADNNIKQVSLEKKYRFIAGILKLFEDKLRIYGVRLGADIFGRVPFYENDIIGQKIEIFDKYLDHIHPMLYPSHFYGMEDRIKNPYQTVYDGVIKSKSRVKNAEIIPYIQAFKMSVQKSGLTYKNYIYRQIQAVYDSKANGFIAWNASNDYSTFFLAMKDYIENNKNNQN